jgi:hypothetical protein
MISSLFIQKSDFAFSCLDWHIALLDQLIHSKQQGEKIKLLREKSLI